MSRLHEMKLGGNDLLIYETVFLRKESNNHCLIHLVNAQ